MQTILSKTSQHGYQQIVKPLLFRKKPDIVHERLLRVGSALQKVTPVRYVIRAVWAYNNEPYLSQEICGIRYKNPVGLSAGFDKNFELVPMIKSVGFGFMEGGSITLHNCAGNPKPWFHRLPKTKSLVVHAGLANHGVVAVIDRLRSYPSSTFVNFPINISVAKTNSKEAASEAEAINDYIGSLKHIAQSDIGDMITINISCPNTFGGEPFTTPKRLDKLLARIDTLQLSQPLFIKMPSQMPWEDYDALLKVAASHIVSGVTVSNLVKDRSTANISDPLPDSVKGNLSGKPAYEASNLLIKKTYQAYGERFVIIGVGGIFSAEDAYAKIKLGASLVELITGMIFEGPQLVGQINQGIVRLLKQDGYSNISEAIGVDAG